MGLFAQWLSTYLAYMRPLWPPVSGQRERGDGYHIRGVGGWIPHTLSIKTSGTARVEELAVEFHDPHLIPGAHMVEEENQGQKEGTATENTCPCTGSGFNSQNLQRSSRVCVTVLPGDLIPSSHLHRHQAHTWHSYIHAGKVLTKFIK